jgi:uncharacterized membrane protein YjjB (DUF3815 family)
MIIQLISVFIGVVGFAMILEVQKKYLFYCGLAGMVGWAAYLLGQSIFPVGSVFFSSFCIALLSQCFARILKCPITVFLIPGIYPSVPGAGIYRTVYYIIMGENSLGGHYFLETLTTAGMIALGIYAVDILWKFRKVN